MGNVFKYILHNQFLASLLIVGSIYLAIELKEILAIIFISFVIMATLAPSVDFLRKNRIPKILAVLIPYLSFISVMLLIIVPLVPFLISQLHSLFLIFPRYVDQAIQLLNLNLDISDINGIFAKDIADIGKKAFLFTGKIFTGVFSLLAIFVISFYFMLGREKIKKEITAFFPKASKEKILAIISSIENTLGAWFRGQIVLLLTIGFTTWVALTLLGIPFALPLAIVAGILEIVPTIGPIIAAIPAVIVALSISPILAVVTIAVYSAIQMLENNILVPKIMERAVGLNPIVIIVGVMMGAKLMGVLGAFLSVPIIATVVILLKNLKTNPNPNN